VDKMTQLTNIFNGMCYLCKNLEIIKKKRLVDFDPSFFPQKDWDFQKKNWIFPGGAAGKKNWFFGKLDSNLLQKRLVKIRNFDTVHC
jgi:hypothetical protein